MSKIEDGGPAFPTSMSAQGPFGGLSIRDWFASQALIGIGTWMPQYRPDGQLVNETGSLCNPGMHRARAEWAYEQADAMLAARKGGAS
jgi:hypothetical protein